MRKSLIAVALSVTAVPGLAHANTSWITIGAGGTISHSGSGSGSDTIDGADYTFSFASMPSPTIIVTGHGTSPNGSHYEATYNYNVSLTGPAPKVGPFVTCISAGSCYSPYSGNSLNSVLTGTGYFYLSSPNAFSVASANGAQLGACDSNLTSDCGLHSYQQTFGPNSISVNGLGYTVFTVPVQIKVTGDLNGGVSDVVTAIDPVLTIDPQFLADSHLDASDFTLHFDGIGNGSNLSALQALVTAVPEPSTWAMMILGFGMIGAAMRRRGIAGARFARRVMA